MGRDNIEISHLQFVDDTLLVGNGDVSNILTIRAILQFFEMASGLKVNFAKSRLMGIGIEHSAMATYVNLLNCKLSVFLSCI